MGSYVHAASVEQVKSDILGVINFEMIGYFRDGEQTYPENSLAQGYPQQANVIAVVGNHRYHAFNQQVFELMRQDAVIDVQMIVTELERLTGKP